MRRHASVLRGAGAAALILVLVMAAGCSNGGGGKATGPQTQPVLAIDWPQEASGVYEVLVEAYVCGLFRCNWDSVNAYVDSVCGFPFRFESDSANGYIVTKTEGVVSGETVDVRIEATVELTDGEVCQMITTMSTGDGNRPPARDGWQVVIEPSFDDCENITGIPVRTTYTRVGDFDCESLARPVSRRLPVYQAGPPAQGRNGEGAYAIRP